MWSPGSYLRDPGENPKMTSSALVQRPPDVHGSDHPAESCELLRARRPNMLQIFGQRHPAEQTAELFLSELVIKTARLNLGTPDVLFPKLINFLLKDPGSQTLQMPKIEQTHVPESSTCRQVEGKVTYWACVDFSCLSTEVTMQFIFRLIDKCEANGMGDSTLAVFFHTNCGVPDVIERTLLDVCGLLTKLGEKTLLIVMLPYLGSFECNAKVEEMCKKLEKLGVLCQCCLPEHSWGESDQYINSTAYEITCKVREYNTFDAPDVIIQDGSDSSELCGFDEDFVNYEALGRGTYGDSVVDAESSDNEDDFGLCSSDSEMDEYDDSEIFEEAYHVETQDAEGSKQIDGSHKQAMPIERTPSEKLPLPISSSFIKRNYIDYGNLQIEQGVVKDWACVNFSDMYARLHLFCGRLYSACIRIGMHFCREPMKTYHVKAAIPDNIAKTFRGVRKSILEEFSRIDALKGEPIGLLLVILPECRDFDAKIDEACKSLGVVYQCCLPSDMYDKYKPDKKYLKQTAREIKSKVVRRDTFIPFVSEGQTIIFGADTSCEDVAAVAASVDYEEFKDYRTVVKPNNGVVIQHLFDEHGGMIDNLLHGLNENIRRDCRIIFFRHGISEDHINDICHQEVLAIKEAWFRLKNGFAPSVTFVVVGGNGEGGYKDKKHDFVCSHGFVEGTQPARYRVFLDENNLTCCDLEAIIIKLCLLRDRQDYPDIHIVPPAYSAWLAASQYKERWRIGQRQTLSIE
ncbi:hypothetical protein EJB05_43691 [Eragrostis curvula]|uniref:Piwi domain-containing protein n=1 Tax=Eragrostis curvula TaxID=38414 RepID=A0A5J9TFN9_9POAL|nr:hypothetical protein EJB05_43691 [Eragrostis curvula]